MKITGHTCNSLVNTRNGLLKLPKIHMLTVVTFKSYIKLLQIESFKGLLKSSTFLYALVNTYVYAVNNKGFVVQFFYNSVDLSKHIIKCYKTIQKYVKIMHF